MEAFVSMDGEKEPFWTSAAGIVTGIAALITAIGGLLGVLYQSGYIGNGSRPEEPASMTKSKPSTSLFNRDLKITKILTGFQFNLSLRFFRLTAQSCARLCFVRVAELRECG